MALWGGQRTAGAGAAAHAGWGSGAGVGSFVGDLRQRFRASFDIEIDQRRPFLWLPAAGGAGVLLYMAADHEPTLWFPALLALACAGAAVLARRRRVVFAVAVAAAAVFAGFFCAAWRSARIEAPVLDHIRIVHLAGFIEEMDFRRTGARFVLRVTTATELDAKQAPFRVRLTTRRTPEVEAGAYVAVTARLLPPAQAVLPGGYDFARDAYFDRIGAVGSALGHLESRTAPTAPGLLLGAAMALDRMRNAMARRVDATIGGDAGAIAAAMVTGKRDLLSDDAKEVIREAGIFHIITISGVQMTLVAGILFVTIRRCLALSRTLALQFEIKKWAAAAAMVGAVGYDLATGSRVGTQRALFMTLVIFASVLVDRRGFTMRNLAYAALAVIAFEPEAILGASFQLSFAAVAALIAVHEGRLVARRTPTAIPNRPAYPHGSGFLGWPLHAFGHLRQLVFATVCATAATASFMAYNFHELSPYVLVGNPLTLALIELCAVPGALLGTLLAPLGLDEPVWIYLGVGIRFIIWVARWIGAAPASTVHVNAFAPGAVLWLALAVLSAVIWRTWLLRLTAVPLLALGLWGAASGPRYDLLVAPSGDAVALRAADGRLTIVSPHPNAFAEEQWLRADGDGKDAGEARAADARCDRLGCVAHLADGRPLSIVLDPAAFPDDCDRAAVIVSRLTAPAWCHAAVVVDAPKLHERGATAITFVGNDVAIVSARTAVTDRPWSAAPAETTTTAPRTEASAAKAPADAGQAEGPGTDGMPEPVQ